MLRAGVKLLQAIRQKCDAQLPEEACGLLLGRIAGDDISILRAVAVENAWPERDERTHRFAIDPLVQMKAEQKAAAEGLELIGFYHSHPKGRAVPSELDRSVAWPKYVYLILGYDEPAGPTPRAWTLDASVAFVEHPIEIEETVPSDL